MELVLPSAAAKVEVCLDISANVPDRVRGDAGRLRQVLLNLPRNAVKFTQQGEVTLLSVTGRIRAQMENKNLSLLFATPDRNSCRSEIDFFKPFSQVDASTNRAYGGTGLACNLQTTGCVHGGSISVASTPGVGSLHFHCDDALRRKFCGRVPIPKAARTAHFVVDDNKQSRAILRRMLESRILRSMTQAMPNVRASCLRRLCMHVCFSIILCLITLL